MSSLAAAKADNFYYPPDFDPKKHQTLNKYNGQHPLRERASKLDQGILVIRFEIPFNIWCDKCGEHIAKGERFNAEKKAIGQYHSTKILQFTMTHHCGCKITIQTDPKRAEYLVVEGARKKEESYSAADAEVIELPDDAERERRERDPLYRLEYQQGAKAKALSGAERLAAIHDAVDARAADPYSLNRAMRAALRGEKRAAAAADARRQELGLPDGVALLAPSDGDALAAQVAFLTSSARASAGAEAQRKRILEQDIFAAGARSAAAQGGLPLPPPPPAKRPALGPVKVRAAAPAESGQAQPGTAGEQADELAQQQQQSRGAAAQDPPPAASGPAAGSSGSSQQQQQQQQQHRHGTVAGATTGVSHPSRGAGGGAPSTAAASGGSGNGNGRPPPGAAALAAAAARAAAAAQAPRNTTAKLAGLSGGAGAVREPAAVHTLGRSLGAMPGANGGGGGGVPGAQKRSIKDRAAEMQRRRQGLGGVGLTLSRPEL